MRDLEKSSNKKSAISKNTESLQKQRENLRGILETKKKENREFEEALLKQFENDKTLQCAFPRIPVATAAA